MENITEKTKILLSVTGLSPQVVTETLFALYRLGESLPDQVHILTTAEGAERACLTLINDQWLERFYQDYHLDPPLFNEQHIHILQKPDGEHLQDIRSQDDNRAMADSITEWIRKFTADSANQLHVSIAGGRKTMGFYAGYALSLYGRLQDRLSHVLVAADYESHPQFYYPTPYSQTIYGNDPTRKPLDTQKAEVILAEIDFVRLRHGLDEALLLGRSSFSESVGRAQQALGPASLEIEPEQRRINAQGIVIRLAPTELAFYCWIVRRQLNNEQPPKCPSDGAPERPYADQYLAEYLLITGEMGAAERTIENLQEGMSKSFFEQRKSRLNRQLKDALELAAEPYLIQAVGKRPSTRYRINLEKEQIHYV